MLVLFERAGAIGKRLDPDFDAYACGKDCRQMDDYTIEQFIGVAEQAIDAFDALERGVR